MPLRIVRTCRMDSKGRDRLELFKLPLLSIEPLRLSTSIVWSIPMIPSMVMDATMTNTIGQGL